MEFVWESFLSLAVEDLGAVWLNDVLLILQQFLLPTKVDFISLMLIIVWKYGHATSQNSFIFVFDFFVA